MFSYTNKKYVLATVLTLTMGNSALAIEDYQVKEGDSLWKLSLHYFQDPLYWRCIWRHNGWIKNPAIIQPGQTIDIPHSLDCATELPFPTTKSEVELNRISKTTNSPAANLPIQPVVTLQQRKDTRYLTSQGVEEVMIYTRNGYEMVPVNLIVDQYKREAQVRSKLLPDNVIIDENLVRSLFPSDPRLKKE